MAVYTVFKALGLDIEVRAILDTNLQEFEDYYEAHEENYKEHEEYAYGTRNQNRMQPYTPPIFQSHAVVGGLGGRGVSEIGARDENLDEIVQAWSGNFKKVEWVNAPRQSELDMVHLTVSIPGCCFGCETLMLIVWQRSWHWDAVLSRRASRSDTCCFAAQYSRGGK
jgi:hypothetical protein